MVNVERLRGELEFVTRNRSHHNQADWFREVPDNACKTTGCLAGWTAIHHAKDQLQAKNNEVWLGDKYVSVINYEPKHESWTYLGMRLLDLNYDEAEAMFEADNSIWDLWNLARIITRGEIEIPEAVDAIREDQYNRTEEDYDYSWLVEEEYL